MDTVFINNILFKNSDNKCLLINESGSCSSLNKDFEFSDENFNNILNRDNGFSLIILSKSRIFIAVDRIRTYPLFYSIENGRLLISDDASWIKDNLDIVVLNKGAVTEFSQSGFVTGNETLYKNIFTLQAGEYVNANRNNRQWAIKAKRYFEYYPGKTVHKSPHKLCEELDEILNRVFQNLIEKNKNRLLVVPLSGGIDSRLILYWLKRLGCENVLCYSFGTLHNRDCMIARKVADNLGCKWVFVNLTRKLWRKAYNSKNYHNLKKHYSGYSALMTNQEFPAIYYLIAQNLLPENSVIIPGHTGDFVSGRHIPTNLYDFPLNREAVVDYIFKKHFMLWETIKLKQRKNDFDYLKSRIKDQIGKYEIDCHEDIARIIELYDWQERQAKFIVQFVCVYRLYDISFELPLWSREVMEFFLKVPLKYKLSQKLYKEYLIRYDRDHVFNDITKTENPMTGTRFKIRKIWFKQYLYKIYYNWLYKQLILCFKDDLNFYATISYLRILSSYGRFKGANSFFAQDFIDEMKCDKL